MFPPLIFLSERLDRTLVACLRQSGTVAINVAVYVSSLSEAHFKYNVKHFKKKNVHCKSINCERALPEFNVNVLC